MVLKHMYTIVMEHVSTMLMVMAFVMSWRLLDVQILALVTTMLLLQMRIHLVST